MDLLIDLFGYLSIVVHGLTILAQSIALGGVFFLALLARPLAPLLGTAGRGGGAGHRSASPPGAPSRCCCARPPPSRCRPPCWSAPSICRVTDVLAAQFAIAGLIKMAIAGVIAALLFVRAGRAPVPLLAGLALVELAAATLTTHAVARLDDRVPLLVVEWLHQFGAAIWIGGIPCFLLALAPRRGRRRVAAGRRAVLPHVDGRRGLHPGQRRRRCSWFYIGNLQGFYGTAYGVMVGAKIAMFLLLLALGGMNFLLVERLRADPATPVLRLRRFAEVEIGIGVSIFFAAASLTSVPPAVDLTQDRVSWQEIVERNTPGMAAPEQP